MKKIISFVMCFTVLCSSFLVATENSNYYVDSNGYPTESFFQRLELENNQINQMKSLKDWKRNEKKIYEFEALILNSNMETKLKSMAAISLYANVLAFWISMKDALLAESMRESLKTYEFTSLERKMVRYLLSESEENSVGMNPTGITDELATNQIELYSSKIDSLPSSTE